MKINFWEQELIHAYHYSLGIGGNNNSEYSATYYTYKATGNPFYGQAFHDLLSTSSMFGAEILERYPCPNWLTP